MASARQGASASNSTSDFITSSKGFTRDMELALSSATRLTEVRRGPLSSTKVLQGLPMLFDVYQGVPRFTGILQCPPMPSARHRGPTSPAVGLRLNQQVFPSRRHAVSFSRSRLSFSRSPSAPGQRAEPIVTRLSFKAIVDSIISSAISSSLKASPISGAQFPGTRRG